MGKKQRGEPIHIDLQRICSQSETQGDFNFTELFSLGKNATELILSLEF